jgi:hypothetical protein
MDAKTIDLLSKQVLSSDEISMVQKDKGVKDVISCGKSEEYIDHDWYSVRTHDNKQYNVYVKGK